MSCETCDKCDVDITNDPMAMYCMKCDNDMAEEIKRLRAALEKIRDNDWDCYGPHFSNEARKVANQALDGDE